MRHLVYFLSDPREPNTVRYVGRTSTSLQKRSFDHVSQARFRLKNDLKMAPVMHWLNDLDELGLGPRSTLFLECDSLEKAIAVEEALTLALPYLLNHPAGRCASGRKVGDYHTTETYRGRREKDKTGHARICQVAALKRYVEWKKDMGAPRPDQSLGGGENFAWLRQYPKSFVPYTTWVQQRAK